ncbi:MAG: DUF4399 domain-containing protein [Arachidicoccus sp.]|nr:DUF4399 domain-containing protein [Arachidicoccus sp.]
MRKLFFISAILLTSLVACNSGSSTSSSADSSAVAAAPDSAATAPKADTVPALPAIPAGAKVFFKNLKNGAVVSSPVKLQFGVDNMTVAKKAPVGQIAEGIGHHHLLIDAEDSIPSGEIIPADSTHKHYGGAQIADTITLAPGKHKLTLQFGDAIHRSYGSTLSSTVNITVK